MQNLGFNESNVKIKLVEKQMRLWNAKCTPSDENITKNLGFHFLTVSNDEGSLGTEIIQTLSHKLDWHIFDEEIISYIAENNQISEKLVRKLDQKSENNIQMIIERFLKTIVTNSFGGDEYQRGLLRGIGNYFNRGG